MSPQIATNTPVSRDELLDFIRPRHQAIIITQRQRPPQASPVTCGVDRDGQMWFSTYPERAKTRNARRDPQVSILVLSDDFGGPWVQVEDAEVIDMPEAADALVDYYRAIAGEHPDWDEYRQAMTRQDKSLLRSRPPRGARSRPADSRPPGGMTPGPPRLAGCPGAVWGARASR